MFVWFRIWRERHLAEELSKRAPVGVKVVARIGEVRVGTFEKGVEV